MLSRRIGHQLLWHTACAPRAALLHTSWRSSASAAAAAASVRDRESGYRLRGSTTVSSRGTPNERGPPTRRGSSPTASSSTSPAAATREARSPPAGFSEVKFDDFSRSGALSAQTASGVASLRPPHVFCTEAQAATLPVSLSGVDVLAQAKTGTGKTLAFIIPSIENLLRASPQPRSGQVSVLVLSPTRDLAIQIEDAARALLSATDYGVQHVVGGTSMPAEASRLNRQRCDILVGTPGRLLDHLENGNLKAKLSNLRVLVLDEADRLLEQGFRREVGKIIDCLPNRKAVPRQTLLFSATVPKEVRQLTSIALLPDFSHVSTIGEEDANTHEHVPQHSLVVPLNDSFATTLAVIRSEIAVHGAKTKIMCFFPTARATGLAAALFQELDLGIEVWEIHSRKSQSKRNAVVEAFKVAKNGILFSSDVTARGMDFPGVTTVLQVGQPANAEQYIHRLGRTARAGASGSGIIILAPFEEHFLRKREILALPLAPHPDSRTKFASGSEALRDARTVVATAMSKIDDLQKSQHYAACLGFYKPYLKDSFGSAERMVQVLNDYATSPHGLAYAGGSGEVPGLLASTVGKMGLRGTKGLNIVRSLPGMEASTGPARGGVGRQGTGDSAGAGGARARSPSRRRGPAVFGFE